MLIWAPGILRPLWSYCCIITVLVFCRRVPSNPWPPGPVVCEPSTAHDASPSLPFHISLFHPKPKRSRSPQTRGNNKADRPITALGTHSGSRSAVPTNRLVPRPHSLRAFTIFIPKPSSRPLIFPPPTTHETTSTKRESPTPTAPPIQSHPLAAKSSQTLPLTDLSLVRYGSTSTSVFLSTPSVSEVTRLATCDRVPNLNLPLLTSLHFTSPFLTPYPPSAFPLGTLPQASTCCCFGQYLESHDA
jgi:hypothetical protein